jgi:intracellular sulfur oxidation DsrE/DsrF family protein
MFKACENTIRERKIDRNTLLQQSGTVPSGVAEIVLKQEAGWAYLKY